MGMGGGTTEVVTTNMKNTILNSGGGSIDWRPCRGASRSAPTVG